MSKDHVFITFIAAISCIAKSSLAEDYLIPSCRLKMKKLASDKTHDKGVTLYKLEAKPMGCFVTLL